MTGYIRARSDEQKAERLEQVKEALIRQFEQKPFHEITLTTLAEELGWSRTNLYKYVSTKEEVFLEVLADKRDDYLNALLAAMPAGCGFDNNTIACVWAGIANAHQDYFKYCDLLISVIETNVSYEKLKAFKSGYYDIAAVFGKQMSDVLHIKTEHVERFQLAIYYQCVGLAGSCLNNPLVSKAVQELGIERKQPVFQDEVRDFILMALPWYQAK